MLKVSLSIIILRQLRHVTAIYRFMKTRVSLKPRTLQISPKNNKTRGNNHERKIVLVSFRVSYMVFGRIAKAEFFS